VLLAEDPGYEHNLCENMIPLFCEVQKTKKFSHILACSTSFGMCKPVQL